MSQRRMFSHEIVESDAFLEMPQTTQNLYFHLGMYADDDGFVSPRKIMRLVGASDDDLKVLLGKRFLLSFESGVVVVKHWRVNNFVRKDRYHQTIYAPERASLLVKPNGIYTNDPEQGSPIALTPWKSDMETNGVPLVDQRLTEDRIGKDRIGKDTGNTVDTRTRKRVHSVFTKPSIEDVRVYCTERKNTVDPQRFLDYYESNGWRVGKNAMKDWKAAVRTWENNGYWSNTRQSPARPSNALVTDHSSAIVAAMERKSGQK